MINWLTVRNFVIVRDVEVVFSPGMTVLTGETGAGKSLIVDAMTILLGDRTSADIIRPGADRTEIQAGFDVSANPQAIEWLAEQALTSDDDECILRRVVFHDKASRGFVNGRPVPIQSLRAVGDLLVDIHGQNEHHLLLKRDVQRTTLDAFAHIQSTVTQVGDIHRNISETTEALDALRQLAGEREARESFLRYQISELETLNPEPDEWHSLDQRQTQLAHTRELAEGTWASLQQLTEDESGSASSTLNQASARLHNLAKYDPRLETMATEFDELQVRLTETGNDLRHYLEGYELDPEEYARVQARLGALHEAARKYQVRPEALKDALEKLQQELATTTDSNQQLTVLEQSLSDLNQRYDELAAEVSQARQVAAKQLGKAVTAHLAEFGLTDADFRVKLLPIDEEDRQRYGRERVQFTVRTTHEMAYGPLERVASGGELSRISLALQVVTSAVDPVPISIYDEVDVGIGGRVAEIVGSKLRTLGQDRQVLCITHLPQVAVQGEGHLRVTKASGTRSGVAVETLDPDERIEEIARMLGGVKITRQTRDHARDMLSRVSS